MCKVYNQVGSLTTIKSHLHQHGLKDFKSTNDLISFLKNFSDARQEIITKSSLLINEEKERLKEEIVLLEDFIETCRSEYTNDLLSELEQLKQQRDTLRSARSNFFERINGYFKGNSIQSQIRDIEANFDSKIADSLRRHTDPFIGKKRRLTFIEHNFEKAVQESTYTQLREMDRRKAIVDEIAPSIYGAIGEQKVSNELENLSDDYILINDFTCTFYRPIFNKQEGDYIKSVQIDHILVAPSGIFLIETKNWSEQSIASLNLRSPVEQIKRTNFALYSTLNGKHAISLLQHHWGERKIPIKNLIVMIHQKPKEEFQHVKVLTLKELCSYVEYFKPVFSPMDTKVIANHLLGLCGSSNY